MKGQGIEAMVVPTMDPHNSEYVAEHWQCRRWISGFTGSAGTAIVTLTDALLWIFSELHDDRFKSAFQLLPGESDVPK